MKQRPLGLRIAVMACVVGGAGCSSIAADTDNEPVSSSKDELLLYPPSEETPFAPGASIPVCWMNIPAQVQRQADLKKLYRTAIEDSWAREANIKFTRWLDTCPNSSELFVRIKYQLGVTETAYTVGVGPETLHTASQGASVVINVGGDGNWTSHQRYIAIHEFGHVLGFKHESSRTDRPAGVPCDPGLLGDTWGGISLTNHFDWESIMMPTPCLVNASPPRPIPTKLSAGDIAGLRWQYGHKHDGAIVGFGGRCLRPSAGFSSIGTPIVMNDCAGTDADSFGMFPISAPRWFNLEGRVYPNTGKCVSYPGSYNGAPTTLGGCPVPNWTTQTTSHSFAARQTAIRGFGGKCLSRIASTSYVRMMNCVDGDANQQWTLTPIDGASLSIMSVTAGQCLMVGSSGFVELASCTSPPNGPTWIRWWIQPGGHILSKGDSRLLVLHVPVSNPGDQYGLADGAWPNVIVDTGYGNAQPNIKWNLRTKLAEPGGRVLRAPLNASGSIDNGTQTTLSDDVAPTEGKVFDIYP